MIEVSTVIKVDKSMAFKYFSDSEYIKQWLCADAIINAKKNGAYELFWDLENRNHNSTLACKILSIDSPNHLSFNWKGPVQFEAFMNDCDPLTIVTIIFEAIDKGTKVTLLHSGFRKSDEWQEAKDYFTHAWSGAFKILESLLND